MRLIAWFAVTAPLIACVVFPSPAQDNALQNLLGSSSVPSEMKLKDLGNGWKRVALKRAGAEAGGDMLGKLAQIGMMSQGKGAKDGPEAMMGLSMLENLFGGGDKGEPFYTKGETVRIGDETFLIGYAPEKSAPNFLQMMMEVGTKGGKEPDMEKLMAGGKFTADTPVMLTLVNVRSVASLGGIRPFNLEKEIAESGMSGFLEMFMPHLGMSKEVMAAPAAPEIATPVATRPKPAPAPKASAKPKR